MKPQICLRAVSVPGNESAMRVYPTGGWKLMVLATSGGTNVAGSEPRCEDLVAYLSVEYPVCVAAVALIPPNKTITHGVFLRFELHEGTAQIDLSEPFIHPKYPALITASNAVRVQVGGDWHTTGGVGEVGRRVTTVNICKLFAGTMTEEELIASAEGESHAEELARLRAENEELKALYSGIATAKEELQDELRSQQVSLCNNFDTIKVLVRMLNRIANEGCSLPNSSESYARNADEWLGRSETRGCVTSNALENWIAKIWRHAQHSHQLEQEKCWAQNAERERDLYKNMLREVSSIALGRTVSVSELHNAVAGSEADMSWVGACNEGIRRQITGALTARAYEVGVPLGVIWSHFVPECSPEMGHTQVDKLLQMLKLEIGELIPGLRQLHQEVSERRLPYFPQTVLERLETAWPRLATERVTRKRS